MRALVTGGAGFIGSHVVEALLGRGYAVRVLDSFATGRRENLAAVADEIELVESDIRSYDRVRAAAQGCDVVVHEAALPSVVRSVEDPVATTQVNVIGTLNVLLAARDADVGRLVLGSSSSVYGNGSVLPRTEDVPPEPVSPYAVSKLAAEGYCRSFVDLDGLDAVVLRYFNVLGARQDARAEYVAVIPRFITACLAGDRPTLFGDGEQSRDFTYVEDAAEATVLAVTAGPASGRVLNVAAGRATTLNELVDALQEATGRVIDPVIRPARPGEVRHSVASIEEARRVLGFEPSTGFAEGLARTVDYFANRSAGSMRAASRA